MKNSTLLLIVILFSSMAFVSCYKEPMDYSKSINDLKAQVTALQNRSDSLANALKVTNSSVSSLSKTIDSIKTQLTTINNQLVQLNSQLTGINANIALITSQIATLNQQYATLLAQLNAILNQLAGGNPTTLNTGLIAFYPFNGNPGDSSGNNLHGTINGVVLTTDRFGVNNRAYLFDGTNEISVPHSNFLNLTGDLSISAWFNSYGPPTTRNAHTIVTKRSPNQFHTLPYNLNINYQYGIPSDYKKPMFASATSYPTGYQYLNATTDVSNNTWNHIVATVSSNSLKIYLNGSIVLNTTINNSLRVANTAPLLIGSGARTDKPAEQFVGKLDEIRIYNRAITEAEISYLATH